jgi:predicted esterase
MFRRIEHFLVIIALVVIGTITTAHFLFGVFPTGTSQPSASQIPASVGDKVAPIPVLDVEQIALTNERSLSRTQTRRSISSSVGGQSVNPIYDLKEYDLQWLVSVEDGSLAPVQADVFVPVPTAANQQFPVIVYGAGTTGLADRCAPSRENLARGNMGNYRNYMIAQATQGYIVVMPNYEGFDNPNRNQHYFNKDSEARTMLSAAKATVAGAEPAKLPLKPNALFLGGYSQGGHAAFSAADYAETYVPDLKISGVFGHGPTTEIAEYLEHNPNLAAYFVASYSEYYPAIDPTQILEKEWVGYLERAKRLCVDEGFGINSTTVAAVFANPFETALKNKTLEKDFPAISEVFIENNAGTSYTNIPTMIVQGTSDPIVTNEAQGRFVDQLCDRGVTVDFKEYRGVHHFSTRQVSFRDTNQWMDAITQGLPVNNSCEKRSLL